MRNPRILAALTLAGLASAAFASPEEPARRNVAILIFPGVQIIDYTGPWEVLGHASVDGRPAFRIFTVADARTPLKTAMGMSVNPEFTFDDAPKPDVIVVPGGNVPPHLENAALMKWLRASAKQAEVVLSVCNGAFFLAEAGLLDGLEATTFAGLIDELREAAPKTKVVRDRRFVDNGKIVTAAGLSSGIDGALHVIEKLYGKGAAQLAAVSLEYDWRPDSGYARAALADFQLAPAFGAVREFSRTVVRHEGDRNRWETAWKIQTDAAPDALRSRLDAAFESGGWTRRAGGWRRTGEDGAWIEATRIEPLPAGAKGYLVTLTVSRAR